MKETIGLDIGGTKIEGIVFNGRKVVKVLTIVMPKNLADFKYRLGMLVRFLSAGLKVDNLGVGIPGMVNNRGVVVYAPNIKYLVGFNLIKFLKFAGVKKLKIENDANCFALAEARLGQGKKFKNFVGITLGTGIGGGLILNGSLYSGIHGSAGEVGHMMADSKYSYEYYFQQYRKAKNYTKMGQQLGRMAADVINLLDVQAIILGGSVALSANKFLALIAAEARKHIINKAIKPAIKVSKLKNAGALGAALLVK